MVPERGQGRLRPRKSLGQNFLIDDNIARKIVSAIGPSENDTIVEIGAGTGALSRHLHAVVRELILVELDPRAVARLQQQFPHGSVRIVHQDILRFDLADEAHRAGSKIRVAGNIPYNITSPILFHILDHRQSVRDATLMVQREVARRLVAGPGSKEYGIPSVLFQNFAPVTRLFDVPATVFVPRPEVWSSVIRIEPLERPRCPLADEALFRSMVRAVFGQRRKMLRHTLKQFVGGDVPDQVGPFDLKRRPESLTVEEFALLSNLLSDQIKTPARRDS